MKVQDLRQKTEKELTELLTKLKKEITELYVTINERKEKDVKKQGKTRKDIARVLTVMKEKSILQTSEGNK